MSTTEPVVDEPTVELEVQEESTPTVQDPPVPIMCQPIYLTHDCVLVGLGDSEKSEIKKAISYEDFYQALSGMMNKISREATSNLMLPSNCFFLGYSNNNLLINVYYPETTQTIPFGPKFKGRVPNMILSFKLSRAKTKGDWTMKVDDAKYFCTDIPVSMLPTGFIDRVDSSKRIFLSPFWNTYSEGYMCLGGNMMPNRFPNGNLRGLDYFYQVLFNSPFNNDLGIRGVPEMDTPSWIKALKEGAKTETFPYHHLRGFSPLS